MFVFVFVFMIKLICRSNFYRIIVHEHVRRIVAAGNEHGRSIVPNHHKTQNGKKYINRQLKAVCFRPHCDDPSLKFHFDLVEGP